ALVALDREWVPRGEGGALYIRPVCFATEECLQVRAARSYRFVVVTAPVGTYFSGAIRLLVEERYVRACVGGTGEVKPAGNYAGTLVASMEAQERGYHNVLWLDAREQRFVEEGGVMNLVFVIDDALVTPPLTGTILPGVTRDTLLTLAREAGVRVKERPIAIDEFVRLYREGRVREAAGVGTAATIAPVSAIGYKGEDLLLPLTEDSLLMKMRDTIHDIRTGRVPDSHGWLMHVEEVPA
ncbi:MAG TPA: aminotransferase class IV, partial [Thermoanaerobaculia bacterium]|nr:aminotransferase class IV [Thermoanaerobaculia bacterium]